MSSTCQARQWDQCAGLQTQVVVGKGKSQSIGYLCAWPTQEQRAVIPGFDDTNVDGYWDATNPQNSTKVAGYGTKITVTGRTPAAPCRSPWTIVRLPDQSAEQTTTRAQVTDLGLVISAPT